MIQSDNSQLVSHRGEMMPLWNHHLQVNPRHKNTHEKHQHSSLLKKQLRDAGRRRSGGCVYAMCHVSRICFLEMQLGLAVSFRHAPIRHLLATKLHHQEGRNNGP